MTNQHPEGCDTAESLKWSLNKRLAKQQCIWKQSVEKRFLTIELLQKKKVKPSE